MSMPSVIYPKNLLTKKGSKWHSEVTITMHIYCKRDACEWDVSFESQQFGRVGKCEIKLKTVTGQKNSKYFLQ